MNYKETINYLYHVAPLFQSQGVGAYKPGLQTTNLLDAHLGYTHRQYQTIHVGGTNGKGSCAHTLAALLQLSGLKTGLYTSPHLVDFRERIRVNGQPVPEDYVVQFIERERPFFEPLHPSFFEITTAMAFKYFSDASVDVAVVEVGLGGRLDCTNVITPVLSVITNISLDHTQLLGDTLAAIAREKAGIIKSGIPVVVGEAQPETRRVFAEVAHARRSPITFAEDVPEVLSSEVGTDGLRHYSTRNYGVLTGGLVGECQEKNTNTILCAVSTLRRLGLLGLENMSHATLDRAFRDVCSLTGLRGRWETVQHNPEMVCDTGHNPGGWQYIGHELQQRVSCGQRLHIVFGVMADKDVDQILAELPVEATYYFTQASTPRALAVDELGRRAAAFRLAGKLFQTVLAAIDAARTAAGASDFIYVGGSSFVVADALASLDDGV